MSKELIKGLEGLSPSEWWDIFKEDAFAVAYDIWKAGGTGIDLSAVLRMKH